MYGDGVIYNPLPCCQICLLTPLNIMAELPKVQGVPALVARSIACYLTTSVKYANTCRCMDVCAYFRLDEEPFRLSPSPRFLYLNDQVKQATSKVEYMTKHRTAPIYMYGAIGSGKTSILRRLYEELSEDETLKTRLPENPKAEKYSTQLPPSLIKRIKQHALEQDIKDYEVVQFALEAYLPQKINPEYLKAGKPDSP